MNDNTDIPSNLNVLQKIQARGVLQMFDLVENKGIVVNLILELLKINF